MRFLPGGHVGHDDHNASRAAAAAARRGNRRRLAVFGGVLVAGLLVGELWNYSRPDVFRASARLQVNLPELGGAGAAASSAFASQLQTLNSRPLLQKVAQAMATAGQPLPSDIDQAASQLQAMLRVQPVTGTDVVQLEATGEQPATVLALLTSLPDVVRSELVAHQAQTADAQLDAARQELARLDRDVSERRNQLDRFRSSAGVLAEREENEAVARSKGLSTALNNAIEKDAAAEARLHALTDSNASGRGTAQARDDPTLAAMEARAGQAREELRDMERTYTADFMAMDPHARGLRARLTELERQIAQQRVTGRQTALNVAQEELAGAHAAVERLRNQLTAARPGLQGVSSRIAQAKVLEDDVAQVEKARRDLLERVARLEADQRRRVPSVTVLEAATLPGAPFRPDHGRDSLRVLGGSLLLALLAMALVELFNRPPAPAPMPTATTVVMPPAWGSAGVALADARSDQPLLPWPAAAATPALALSAPLQVLQQPEAAALLNAAQGPTRFICAAALMGLTATELAALRAADIDATGRRLSVRGAWARTLPLPAWLAETLPPPPVGDSPWLRDGDGQALAEADLQSMLACASVDGGLPQGAALTLEVLRDTCIAWLVGQGLRFSDLPARVGRIDAAKLGAFASLAGAAPRRQAADIDPLMPALALAPAA